MSRSVYEENEYSQQAKTDYSTRELKTRPLAGRWNFVRNTGDPEQVGRGKVQPEFQNGWSQHDNSDLQEDLAQHEFRWNLSGVLEFKGTPVLGTWGTLAYTLPGKDEAQPSYIPTAEYSHLIDVWDPTIDDFVLGRMHIYPRDHALEGQVWIFKAVTGVAVHEIKVFEDINPVVVGDDAFIWEVPQDLDQAQIIRVAGFITTAGAGDTEVDIALGDACSSSGSILTDKIVIDSGECGSFQSANPPIVADNTIVTWGQHLHVNVDAVGTGAMGLGVHIIYAPADITSIVLSGAQGPPGGATDFTGNYPGGPGASGTPGGAGSGWTTSTGYDVGDVVENGGTYYVVTVAHTSGATTEPGVGVDWEDFWDELVYNEGDVVNNGGTTYVTIVTHTATTDSEPGVGVDWEDYWMLLVQGHEPYSGFQVVMDGQGYVLDTGVKARLPIPFDCEIIEATLLASVAGSVVVDLWVDDYGSYPPTDADSITAGTPLTLSGANKTTNTALTGWTTSLVAGDVIAIAIESVSTIDNLTMALRVQRP